MNFHHMARKAKAKLAQFSDSVTEQRRLAGEESYSLTYTKSSLHKVFPDLTRAVVDNTVANMEASGYEFNRVKQGANSVYGITIEDVTKIYEYRGHEKLKDFQPNSITVFMCSLKGGVSKTVSGVTLAQSLRTSPNLVPYDIKTLVIDLDPQSSATMFMNHNLTKGSLDTTSAQAMLQDLPKEEILSDYIYPSAIPGVDIMPASIEDAFLAANWEAICVEAEIAKDDIYQVLKKNIIDKIKDEYSFIIVDAGPHIDSFMLNSMVAADILLTPVPPAQVDLHSTLKFLNRLPMLEQKIIDSGAELNVKAHIGFMTKYQDKKRNNIEARRHTKAVFNTMLNKSLPKLDAFERSGESFDTVITGLPKNYEGSAESLKRAKDAAHDFAESFFEMINELRESE